MAFYEPVRNLSLLFIIISFSLTFYNSFASTPQLDTPTQPLYYSGDPIYADIDTVRDKVYVLLNEDLWQYDLLTEEWELLEIAGAMPSDLEEYEFGYNAGTNSLFLWTRGVGVVYEIDLENSSSGRIDRSFPHKNQFGHFPFFHEDALHAFGGYGFWEWHNIITFFNNEIKEWNLQSVKRNSPLPDPRIPRTGIYLPKEKELYIYGGVKSEHNRPDDIHVKTEIIKDIWKYSFQDHIWEEVAIFDDSEISFFRPSHRHQIGMTNSLSSSFYSSVSNIWYLPVSLEDYSDEIYFVKPFNLSEKEDYEVVELPVGNPKQFLISNYLFNQKTNNLVLVGADYLTNTKRLPVKIYQIPEDTLRSSMVSKSGLNIYYLSLVVLLLIILIVMYLKFYSDLNISARKSRLHISDLEQNDWLNDDENRMLQTLIEANSYLDSHELEEKVWPQIDNYDYRRKRRNEIINSINTKFSEKFAKKGTLIERSKDPNDNRRFRYSININLIDTES